jgi:type IV pilus assembly protein PilE
MKFNRGFTLIELMIVVAIVAILSAVALPAYNDYIIRSKIPDATSFLATKRVQMEQYFMDNRSYADLNAGAVTPVACANDTTSSKYFNFSCTVRDANTYTIRAQGKDSMLGFTYTVDQQNAKQTTAVPAGWTANATCWVTKKGGEC